MTTFEGRFWIQGGSEVPGSVVLREDRAFELDLKDFCFDPEQCDRSTPGRIAWSGDPGKIAADYQPRTILGVLEDESKISLLEAHMEPVPPLSVHTLQRFTGQRYVGGAHMATDSDEVQGIRWTWNIASTQTRWAADSTTLVENPVRGDLYSWQRGRDVGLEFLPHEPVPLRTLLEEVQSPCSQLLGLWCAKRPPDTTQTEFLVQEDHWVSYTAATHVHSRLQVTGLLPMRDLKLPVFAWWLPLAAKLDPFHFIANAPMNVLQVDAQVLATALEGIHRRLYDHERPLSPMSKKAVERSMKVARQAGIEALKNEGFNDTALADDLLQGVLNHIDQQSYAERVKQLVVPVANLAPGMFGPDLDEWVAMVKRIRNAQSHQLKVGFDESAVSVYYTASVACRWLLSLTILSKLVPEEHIAAALKESETFQFALANMDGERVWEGFSALATFREESKTVHTTAQEPTNVVA